MAHTYIAALPADAGDVVEASSQLAQSVMAQLNQEPDIHIVINALADVLMHLTLVVEPDEPEQVVDVIVDLARTNLAAERRKGAH